MYPGLRLCCEHDIQEDSDIATCNLFVDNALINEGGGDYSAFMFEFGTHREEAAIALSASAVLALITFGMNI